MTEPIQIEWTKQQADALNVINDWVKNSDDQVAHLFGYAGTGKTTLVQHIADEVDGLVLFGAFTGKAASVLHKKGCAGAKTIHSMIYRSRAKSQEALEKMKAELDELKVTEPIDYDKINDTEKLIAQEEINVKKPFFSKNPDSDVKDAALVIIDECSMVGQYLAEDLLSYGTKILVVGDPAQLPPVKGTGVFVKNVDPLVLLTEIHRQAEGSPILKLATLARQKKPIPLADYGQGCKVVDSVKRGELLSFDQILVGKNATRRGMNKVCRAMLGRKGEYPEVGDKLVCLRNNASKGLLNGALFKIVEVGDMAVEGIISMSVEPEDGGDSILVNCYEEPFYGKDLEATTWGGGCDEFDYGYALTVHKSQGSQWDKVLLIDESSVFKHNAANHLYTAITRAAEQITIKKV